MIDPKEHRSRKSQKLIFEMMVSRQRSESMNIIEQAKKFHDMSVDEKESFNNRVNCLYELDHALDWFFDRIINDRRK